jgi:hypothetical protein
MWAIPNRHHEALQVSAISLELLPSTKKEGGCSFSLNEETRETDMSLFHVT